MQIWAETGKSALPIRNYSQILYQFLTFTQNLKRSPNQRRLVFCLPPQLFAYLFDINSDYYHYVTIFIYLPLLYALNSGI